MNRKSAFYQDLIKIILDMIHEKPPRDSLSYWCDEALRTILDHKASAEMEACEAVRYGNPIGVADSFDNIIDMIYMICYMFSDDVFVGEDKDLYNILDDIEVELDKYEDWANGEG